MPPGSLGSAILVSTATKFLRLPSRQKVLKLAVNAGLGLNTNVGCTVDTTVLDTFDTRPLALIPTAAKENTLDLLMTNLVNGASVLKVNVEVNALAACFLNPGKAVILLALLRIAIKKYKGSNT